MSFKPFASFKPAFTANKETVLTGTVAPAPVAEGSMVLSTAEVGRRLNKVYVTTKSVLRVKAVVAKANATSMVASSKEQSTGLVAKASAVAGDIKGGTFMDKLKSINVKDNAFTRFISKATSKVVGFVKKHAVKATMGLVSLTVAGTLTTGMGAAVLLSMALYATTAYTVDVVRAKLNKDSSRSHADMIMDAAGDAGWYGALGAVALFFVSGFAVAVLVNTAVYAYVGYTYMGYFLVA